MCLAGSSGLTNGMAVDSSERSPRYCVIVVVDVLFSEILIAKRHHEISSVITVVTKD